MKQRIAYLDFLRCLAILFVIVLHVMTPILSNTGFYGLNAWYLCLLQNPFNRAGVPLFFMISGYLLLRNPVTANIGPFYKKHIFKLAIPLLCWNVIYYLDGTHRAGDGFNLSALFSSLFNNGSSYHMWFVYTMIGIYLIVPFLKRIVDGCTLGQLMLLILIIAFPTTLRPFFNTVTSGYIYIFEPLMEGYVGYFLLGYVLGSCELSALVRCGIYLGGFAGYLLDVLGNFQDASPDAISLPFNGGYSLNHYLCATALFVFFKVLFSKHPIHFQIAAGLLSGASDIVFGVYWVHVLILTNISGALKASIPIMGILGIEISVTLAGSFLAAWALSKIPIARKVLL